MLQASQRKSVRRLARKSKSLSKEKSVSLEASFSAGTRITSCLNKRAFHRLCPPPHSSTRVEKQQLKRQYLVYLFIFFFRTERWVNLYCHPWQGSKLRSYRTYGTIDVNLLLMGRPFNFMAEVYNKFFNQQFKCKKIKHFKCIQDSRALCFVLLLVICSEGIRLRV